MIKKMNLSIQLKENDCALALGREICMKSILNLNINKNNIKILTPSVRTEIKNILIIPSFQAISNIKHEVGLKRPVRWAPTSLCPSIKEQHHLEHKSS